jgi:uncharacterized protein (TIGR00290 family)
MKKYLLSWSGGKDSALALYQCLRRSDIEVTGLFTTVNEATNRISMHGVSVELLKKQAESIGLPLHILSLPEPCTMDNYEKIMGDFMVAMKKNGVEGVVFGDIFLEDIRNYRVKQLAKIDLQPLFPLWGETSKNVANDFIASGFYSIITCVDGELMNESYVGQVFSKSFIDKLPDKVDPCGENGEFHSFVFDGPIFRYPLFLQVEKKVKIEYPNPRGEKQRPFWFAEIVSK